MMSIVPVKAGPKSTCIASVVAKWMTVVALVGLFWGVCACVDQGIEGQEVCGDTEGPSMKHWGRTHRLDELSVGPAMAEELLDLLLGHGHALLHHHHPTPWKN